MDILLDGIIPHPLKDSYRQSGVWGAQISLEAGSSYLFNAPSGNGKSTLLSYIYGLRKDFSGKVVHEGKDASTYSLDDWARLRQSRVSMMFQDLRLFDELTARQNIEVKRKLAGGINDKLLEQMLIAIGILEFVDKPVKFLSMGQQQRVALVRALVQPFQWLLLDEPFSHIDRQNISKAEQLIQEACSRNNAGLIVTTLGERYDIPYKEVYSI